MGAPCPHSSLLNISEYGAGNEFYKRPPILHKPSIMFELKHLKTSESIRFVHLTGKKKTRSPGWQRHAFWQWRSSLEVGSGASSRHNIYCKLSAGRDVRASVLQSASVTQRGVGGRRRTDKKQIYIGTAPAVSGSNLNRWLLQRLSSARQGAETLDSLRAR